MTKRLTNEEAMRWAFKASDEERKAFGTLLKLIEAARRIRTQRERSRRKGKIRRGN